MLTTAGGVTRKTRRGRTATVRPSTIFINNGDIISTLTAARRQHLAVYGLTGRLAHIVAELLWENRDD